MLNIFRMFLSIWSVNIVLLFAGSANAQPPVAEDLQKLAKAYKLEILTADLKFPVETTHGAIDGKAAPMKEVLTYTKLLVDEFSLYPPDLVKRTKLKRIILCEELSFAGQRRNAIPDFEHDTLYLEVVRGSYDKQYLRRVIHHEFFHIVDLRDDGSLYRDERWAALNPAEFKYGKGGKNAQKVPDTSVLSDKYPGFLNHYSTTGVEEDKAELFAYLVVEGERVDARAKKDRVLNAKVERLKELMTAFCPEANEKFWGKTRSLKRDQPE